MDSDFQKKLLIGTQVNSLLQNETHQLHRGNKSICWKKLSLALPKKNLEFSLGTHQTTLFSQGLPEIQAAELIDDKRNDLLFRSLLLFLPVGHIVLLVCRASVRWSRFVMALVSVKTARKGMRKLMK